METRKLIEAYLLQSLEGYTDLRLDSYSLNGSVIKIYYSYTESYSTNGGIESYESNDNVIEVDLLDYITFVYSFLRPI